METYCGKSCGSCPWKAELACEGCKSGPGQPLYGDCKLAACCRTARHETCDTCMDRRYCKMLDGKAGIPEDRLRRRRIEAAQQAELQRRAPILGKWLTVLFWLFILTEAVALLELPFLLERFPGLAIFCGILDFGIMLACGLVLLRLSLVESGYKWAGILFLAVGVLHGLQVLLEQTSAGPVLLIAATVLALLMKYQELHAHADAVSSVDRALSEHFLSLWKWYIWCTAATIGGVLVALVAPVLGSLLAISGGIGTLVVGIRKLISLWQAAALFRQF